MFWCPDDQAERLADSAPVETFEILVDCMLEVMSRTFH
jgi:hypothetical protein